MLSPASVSLISDTLNVSYPLYLGIANPKEIISFKFLFFGRDTEYKMISSEKNVLTYCLLYRAIKELTGNFLLTKKGGSGCQYSLGEGVFSQRVFCD